MTTEWVARRLRPLTIAVLTATVVVFLLLAQRRSLLTGQWWQFAALFAGFLATESTQVHVDVRRHTFSLSMSEIPMVLGLFAVGAVPLAAARVLAAAVVGRRRRTTAAKLAFNLASFAAEAGVMSLVFALLTPQHPRGATAVVGASAAVGVATVVTGVVVLAALVRLQGRPQRSVVLGLSGTAATTAVLNGSAALLAQLSVGATPAALPLLAVLLGVLAGAYHAYSSLARRHRSLSELHNLTRMIGATPSDGHGFDAVLARVREMLHADQAVVWVPAPAPSGRCWSSALDGRADSACSIRELLADEVVQRASDTGLSRVLGRDTISGAEQAFLRRHGLRDAIIVPIRTGRAPSVLIVTDRLGDMGTFNEADSQLLEVIAAHIGAALDNAELVDRLRYDAHHDALTGLPNRVLFHHRLEQALVEPATDRIAVLLMDLDGFKDVNDTLGHHCGDQMLMEVAQRLRSAVPDVVTVARLGGDEFALLVPLMTPDAEPMFVADMLHTALSRPFHLDSMRLEIRSSTGIAVFPEHADDGATLLQRADIAMYNAKSSDRPVAMYDAEQDRSNPRRLALVSELRRAIDDGTLAVAYQPKIRLADERVTGFEALARWTHPSFGAIRPDEFIPIAEHTGLIQPLTRLILDQALAQVRSWRDAGNELNVAVNVSARALLAPDFVTDIAAALARHGVPADALILEITESVVMTDTDRALELLTALRQLGVTLSVDDFGTGYSSLSYLQRLPVHEVKIDKSFVLTLATNPGSAAIVRAIIELGHSLELGVVAEGVEDRQSLELLGGLNCDLCQGFFVSKPLSAAEAQSWLHNHTRIQHNSRGATGNVTRLSAVR